METLIAFFYVLAGFLLRLAIPIAGTILLVFFLRKMDARWQVEAEREALAVDKPQCWKIKGCTAEQAQDCPAGSSPMPCWQVNRLPNGYLNEKCITCEVFTEAPVPTLRAEPRRL
jgi:hypothetical protein